MLDYIEYTAIEGTNTTHDIEVYALSTCGFCKRALAFLNAEGFSYRFIHLDLIDFDVKMRAKEALREAHGVPVSFPFAVIDGTRTLVGFTESDWRRVLLGTANA